MYIKGEIQMKNEKFFFKWQFIFAIEAIVSIFLGVVVYRLGVLPMKYISVVMIGLLVMNLVSALLLWKTKNKLNGFIKIVTLLTVIGLLVASKYVIEGGSFIGSITGANKDSHVISVIVEKDSPFKTLKDVQGEVFGANTKMDKENIDQSKGLLKKKMGAEPQVKDYQSYEDLIGDIYSKELKVILLSESQRALVESIDEDFRTKTRVIDFVSYEVENEVKESNVNVNEDTYTMFITGIDTYGPVSTVSRSDVNMLMTVNPNKNEILLTSIPRDYHVMLGTKGAKDKLTHAGIYGINESIVTLEKLLDIEIDYYIKTNFNSVEQVVDALGGVDVYSEHTFVSRHGGYQFNAGMNHMNGPQSIGFVRERYSLPGGDNDRVKNQQELLKGIINKATSPAIITNYNSILNSVSDSMEMSMGDKELKAIIQKQLDTNASWNILQYQLTGTGSTSSTTYSMPGYKLYVMEPNYDTVNKAHDLIRKLESNASIAAEV